MTEQQRLHMRNLIPDLLPLDHVSMNTKRIRFIHGQGIVLFDDTFAVEIYIPLVAGEQPEFFGVQRHFGKIDELFDYYRKPKVVAYNEAGDVIRRQFDEAVFQYQPMNFKVDSRMDTTQGRASNQQVHEAIQIYLHENLSGAA